MKTDVLWKPDSQDPFTALICAVCNWLMDKYLLAIFTTLSPEGRQNSSPLFTMNHAGNRVTDYFFYAEINVKKPLI